MFNSFNFDNDYEDWEDDVYFFDNEDWIGLLKLRKERYLKQPDNHYAAQRYGEALVMNERYEDAIEFLTPFYAENPNFEDIIYVILDALFRQGKTEKDYEWVRNPDILRLDGITKGMCLELLKNKRKQIPLTEIYIQLQLHGEYMAFDEEELVEFLRNDARFDLDEIENEFWNCEVKLAKKTARKNKDAS